MMPVPRRGRQARRPPRPRAATARGNRLPSYYGHLAEASATPAYTMLETFSNDAMPFSKSPCQHLANRSCAGGVGRIKLAHGTIHMRDNEAKAL